MTRVSASGVVSAAGLIQGVTLVTVPAASSILTSPSDYGLSSAQYGDVFLPQVVAAVLAALLGSRLVSRTGPKEVLLTGLGANVVAMALLVASWPVRTDFSAAYPMLLLATTFIGLGFGLGVPVLNTMTAALHPQAVDKAVLSLNALLGLGTALAPVFVAVFDGLGIWWGMPLAVGVLLAALIPACIRSQMPTGTVSSLPTDPGRQRSRVPPRFLLFAAFAVLYGVCETMNGNWSQLYLTGHLGASSAVASIALASFWAMVTVGRLAFAAVGRWVPSRVAYHCLPFVLVASFVVLALLPHGATWSGVVVFAVAGLGCSALLPLTMSLGQETYPAIPAAVAGGIIAFYQVGYGVAAFGVGPLMSHGYSLSAIYGLAAVAAGASAVLSFVLAHGRPSPARIHPRPAAHPATVS